MTHVGEKLGFLGIGVRSLAGGGISEFDGLLKLSIYGSSPAFGGNQVIYETVSCENHKTEHPDHDPRHSGNEERRVRGRRIEDRVDGPDRVGQNGAGDLRHRVYPESGRAEPVPQFPAGRQARQKLGGTYASRIPLEKEPTATRSFKCAGSGKTSRNRTVRTPTMCTTRPFGRSPLNS